MSVLQEQGLHPRTIYNQIARITTLLRSHKIIGLLARHDKPQYDEKVPDAYDSDQLQALFAAALPEERMLFEFFLGRSLHTWLGAETRSGSSWSIRSEPSRLSSNGKSPKGAAKLPTP
jgi:hypothetical protein